MSKSMFDRTRNMRKGVWQKGKKTITGYWEYYRPSDTFIILLDSTDPVTGKDRTITVKGEEKPEWNGWKLVKEAKDAA